MTRSIDSPVVLFVDDEPEVLEALRRTLRREPYELLATSQPQQALDWIERRDVSLVVTDQRMPEMSGTELLEEIWKTRPSTTRVILTNYPQSLLSLSGLPTPIQHTFLKPWDNDVFKRAIRRLLREREFEEPDLEPESDSR